MIFRTENTYKLGNMEFSTTDELERFLNYICQTEEQIPEKIQGVIAFTIARNILSKKSTKERLEFFNKILSYLNVPSAANILLESIITMVKEDVFFKEIVHEVFKFQKSPANIILYQKLAVLSDVDRNIRDGLYNSMVDMCSKKLIIDYSVPIDYDFLKLIIQDYCSMTTNQQETISEILFTSHGDRLVSVFSKIEDKEILADFIVSILSLSTSLSTDRSQWETIYRCIASLQDKISILQKKMASSKALDNLKSVHLTYARAIKFILGVNNKLTKSMFNFDMSEMALMIPCLSKASFYKVLDYLYDDITYSPCLLNHPIIMQEPKLLIRLLQQYTHAGRRKSKLDRPVLIIGKNIIDELTDNEKIYLAETSYRVEEEYDSIKVVPVRFTFTEEALENMTATLTAATVAMNLSPDVLKHFITAHRKGEVTNMTEKSIGTVTYPEVREYRRISQTRLW